MLGDAATYLTLPPGSLAYHLVVLTMLAVLVTLAGTPVLRAAAGARRAFLAGLSLLVLRLILLAASAFGLERLSSGMSLVSTLGQFAALAGLLTLGWAATFPQRSPAGDPLVGLALLLAGISLAAALILPTLPGVDVPLAPLWMEIAWASAGIVLSVALIVFVLIRRPRAWGIVSVGLLLLLAGFAAQAWQLISSGFPQPLFGLVRLGEFVAYPVLGLAFARSLTAAALEGNAAAVARPEEQQKAEATKAASPLPPVTDFLGLITAETSSELAREAIRAISRLLRAEYTLLLTPPDESGHFAIDVGYDLISEQYIPGAPLDSQRAPIFHAALTQHRTLVLPARSRSPDMQAVQTALVLETTGPAMLVPMVLDGRLYGAILTLSPYARHEWSADDRHSLEALARTLAARLEQMRIAQARATEATPEALEDAERRIQALLEENARLASEGPQAIAGPRPEDLATLLAMNEEARETISILEAEIERLKAAQSFRPSGTQEEVENLTLRLESVLQELAEARARLAALEASGGRLPGTSAALDADALLSIAHDFHPAIDAIHDYTSLLLGETVGSLTPTQRRLLDKVRSACERLMALLQDLVQVATVEAGKIHLTLAPVDLAACLEQALHQAEGTLRARQVTLRFDFPEAQPSALGDANAITQAMVHLMHNAANVSPEGSEIVAAIKIPPAEPEGSPRFLTTSFTDAGDGIPPEQIGRVFDRLSPEERARIPGVAATGVSLPLVRALVEAMGGRVWVDSVFGVGSTFTFILPIAEASEAPPAA